MQPIKRIEDLVKKVDPKDLYLRDKWIDYADQRLVGVTKKAKTFGINELKSSVKEIQLMNGYLGSEIENNKTEIIFNLTRESAFLDERDGILKIAQPSSRDRQSRFEDMIYTAYQLSKNKWNPDFISIAKNNELFTFEQYNQNAKELISNISAKFDLSNIKNIMIGPLDWIKDASKTNENVLSFLEAPKNEYLNYAVLHGKNNEFALCFDYTYSGQINFLLRNLLINYGVKSNGKTSKLNLLMFGKVGGLMPYHEINDFVAPNGLIQVKDNTYQKVIGPYKFYNVFGEKIYSRKELFITHASSIPLQRSSVLKNSLDYGAKITEMEMLYLLNTVNNINGHFPDELDLDIGYACFVSDLPFKKDQTIADEKNQKIGQAKVTNACIDYAFK